MKITTFFVLSFIFCLFFLPLSRFSVYFLFFSFFFLSFFLSLSLLSIPHPFLLPLFFFSRFAIILYFFCFFACCFFLFGERENYFFRKNHLISDFSQVKRRDILFLRSRLFLLQYFFISFKNLIIKCREEKY